MSDEVKVLEILIQNGSLDSEDVKVLGIAKLAIDKGYDHLTAPQRYIVDPFLSRDCDGVTDPGGYHNECQATLEGANLVKSLENEAYYGAVLCENCIDVSEQYSREWEKIQAE
ncbi:hypothetical protein [Pseudomonas fluorescens]|uniref:hypothetical protein n=1 Tax=Pseudomonas fluorescens TaxID=294 RepID=UPI00124029CE|nr:hypothetical protein [Pseudomonas fluorescens]VVO49427.1 hypothetical protein PS898_00201 [Pseudomonas fluorescens]